MTVKLIAELQSKIEEVILPLAKGVDPGLICILDVPNYPNVGDPAILIGELAFIRKNYPGAKLMLVSNGHFDESVAKEVDRADIVFLHGGGSFGDIWPQHHDFRLLMLERFSSREIIQFPQSIHFQSDAVLKKTKQAIAKAAGYVVVARDAKSRDFASLEFDCEVRMAPDMAFCMGPLAASRPVVDLVCLLRTDKEQVKGSSSAVRSLIEEIAIDHEVFDWLKNRNNIERVHQIIERLSNVGLSNRFLARNGSYLYEAYARSRLRFGQDMLSRGSVVLTDRLHGHIISTLMNKKQIVMDSMDGKVKMFNKTWLSGYKNAVFVSDNSELKTSLEEIKEKKK